jgi:hypothetical protein
MVFNLLLFILRTRDPTYFKTCKVSVNALIKMLIHSCLGSNLYLQLELTQKKTMKLWELSKEASKRIHSSYMISYKFMLKQVKLQLF